MQMITLAPRRKVAMSLCGVGNENQRTTTEEGRILAEDKADVE